MKTPEKPEFWEVNFVDKKEMWGFTPAQSTVMANEFFVEKSLKNILIPGIGYGRNAQLFKENGMTVTGIEISKTAIEMAQKHYGEGLKIFHGSVTDMPFDSQKYDGIFCYALIHLLDTEERKKLIRDCYAQLEKGGYMIFTMITKEAHTYGTGKHLGPDRYEIIDGVNMFFYDRESVHREFDAFGLIDITTVQENFPFFWVKCQKI